MNSVVYLALLMGSRTGSSVVLIRLGEWWCAVGLWCWPELEVRVTHPHVILYVGQDAAPSKWVLTICKL